MTVFWSTTFLVTSKLPYPHVYPICIRYGNMMGTIEIIFFFNGCESWTIKKAECRRIDAFELWCWRLLRVPWTARRSNNSILKEINPKYSLEELTPTLKTPTLATWWEEPTHWKRPWCWERLKAGEGDDRGRGSWIASPTQWTWVWASLRRWWGEGNGTPLQYCCLENPMDGGAW